MAPLKRPQKLAAASGLALICLVAFFSLSKSGKAADAAGTPPAQNAPIPVTTVSARSGDVPVYQTGVGNVAANATVTVKVQVSGKLEKVGFKEGQDVKAGQLLAQIDPRPLKAQLAQNEAQRAHDEAQLANAKVDLQRYTTLAQQDSVTQQTLSTQKALVAQLTATVQTDEALIQYTRVQLGYTTITAPISGRVGARLVDPGNIVNTADTTGLVVINQVDPITVVFTLPEETFQAINSAQQSSHKPLPIDAFDHASNQLLGHGSLTMVNNQIDTSSGTVQLKGSFSNPGHKLWPGQYVDARLNLGMTPHAITVPAAAIQRGPNGTYVYRIGSDKKAVNQPVTVDRIQDGFAVIAKGLSAGAHVVTDGQYKLKPGALVVEKMAPGQGAAQ
jgi:multidrug efflux system membrane fusion protein